MYKKKKIFQQQKFGLWVYNTHSLLDTVYLRALYFCNCNISMSFFLSPFPQSKVVRLPFLPQKLIESRHLSREALKVFSALVVVDDEGFDETGWLLARIDATSTLVSCTWAKSALLSLMENFFMRTQTICTHVCFVFLGFEKKLHVHDGVSLISTLNDTPPVVVNLREIEFFSSFNFSHANVWVFAFERVSVNPFDVFERRLSFLRLNGLSSADSSEDDPNDLLFGLCRQFSSRKSRDGPLSFIPNNSSSAYDCTYKWNQNNYHNTK